MHLLSYIDIFRKVSQHNNELGKERILRAHILALSERPNAYWHSRVRPMVPVVLLCCQPLTQLVQFDGVIVENKTSDC